MIGAFCRTDNYKERICVQTDLVNKHYLLRFRSRCRGKLYLMISVGLTQFGETGVGRESYHSSQAYSSMGLKKVRQTDTSVAEGMTLLFSNRRA